jgi:hypothetical protein
LTYTHRVFFTTNEKVTASVREALATKKPTGNVLIGVSCFEILNQFAHHRLTQADTTVDSVVVIDCSTRVQFFWLKTAELVLTYDHVDGFTDAFFTMVEDNKEILFGSIDGIDPKTVLATQIKILAQNASQSWMKSQKSYEVVRDLFLSGRFMFFLADIFDVDTIVPVAEYLKANHLVAEALYLSNVKEYAKTALNVGNYVVSVQLLSTPTTQLLDTHPRPSKETVLIQRIREVGTLHEEDFTGEFIHAFHF